MIGKLRFVALALAAAAIAAPFAGAQSDPGFAQAYLEKLGLTPAQASEWTTGVCSFAVKPSSCELTPAQARAASIGLAQALLGNSGLTRTQIGDWVQGTCSYRVKPASCYLTPAAAALASKRLAESLGAPVSPPAAGAVSPGGFSWGDALIGAAVTAGVFLLGMAGALAVRRRREPARG